MRAKKKLLAALVFEIFAFIILIIKANVFEHIDEAGILHEAFFLIPVAYAFIIAGIVFAIMALITRYKNSNQT